jgi:aerobic-type carbon monoxide dehydrogenase small subunit (CoxS/CutS family)
MTKMMTVELTINGEKIRREVRENRFLWQFLQDHLGLSGTKVCCGMGVCRACTVAMAQGPGAPLRRASACVTPMASLNGAHITTVEGLARDFELSALQKAFLEHFSFQCGYSAPGFLMSATVLLDELKRAPIPKDKVDDAVMQAVGDHVCRCSGYVKYHSAIREVILATPGLTT